MAGMITVLVLLVAMVALIARPFVFPELAATAPLPTPIASEPTPDIAVPAIDVRLQVEAAIAARKAALAPNSATRACASCRAPAEPEDGFCRKCGTKLTS